MNKQTWQEKAIAEAAKINPTTAPTFLHVQTLMISEYKEMEMTIKARVAAGKCVILAFSAEREVTLGWFE